MLNTFKDVVGVLLLAFLLPVWMALGLGVVAFVIGRQLYWWARGNTTAVSRLARVRSSPRRRASTASTDRAPGRDPVAAITVAGLVDTPAAGALNPAITVASEPRTAPVL